MRVQTGLLTDAHLTHGRCCTASNKARRKRQPHEVGAASARPNETKSAHAHPAAAPTAAGAAPEAARTAAPAQAAQGATGMVQRGRAEGHAAAVPAHPAEECGAAPLPPPAARARNTAAATAAGAAPHALGTFDSASEPDDASGNDPHAGGACHLSLAVLMVSRVLLSPNSLCLLIAAVRV